MGMPMGSPMGVPTGTQWELPWNFHWNLQWVGLGGGGSGQAEFASILLEKII